MKIKLIIFWADNEEILFFDNFKDFNLKTRELNIKGIGYTAEDLIKTDK